MSIIPLTITAHIENQGDVTVSGPQQFAGTKGQSRRLEGFTIQNPQLAGLTIEYMAHIENQGDTHWHQNGQYVGTRGQSRRIEGFAIRLSGFAAGSYDVKYYAHVANYGDSPICSNGDFVGTRGQARRVEGMAVWLEYRGNTPTSPPSFTPSYAPPPVAYTPQPAYPTPGYPQPAYPSYPPGYPQPGYPAQPAYPPQPAYTPVVAYSPQPAFVAPVYPMAVPAAVAPPQVRVTVIPSGMGGMTVYGNQFAGTKGQSRKLESLAISVEYPGLDIEYMAHVENKGDTHWHRNGQPIGHQGGGRIEGFAVRLCGPNSGQFEVKYYAHVQDQGDTPIASNGSFVGTRGQSKRVEGLAVWVEARRY